MTVVESEREALEAVQQKKSHGLLVDVPMPNDDSGDRLGARIRAMPPERGGQTSAAALTAVHRADDRARLLRAGAFPYHAARPLARHSGAAVVANLATE